VSDPFIIPSERLPPGFAESIERPPATPIVPQPAATAVLLRDGPTGLEVLLLKRHRASGFVPGAYVFPGGRVDAGDRLVQWDGPVEPPAEYWIAAVREVFEETGVLLARTTNGEWAGSSDQDASLESWREQLMQDKTSLGELLSQNSFRLDPDALAYMAHWITPVPEPRRYDTRFFLARLPEAATVRADSREMTDAQWLSPATALNRFEAGSLPMVFPTVKTLQSLRAYGSADDAVATFRNRTITPILPTLVRTPDGVGIVIEQDTE
jgi:8-oxo-dGTP pyrophosphatase MutT (NUDIX family)